MDYLPDYLPGNPPMYGVKQETPALPQGMDMFIPLDFSQFSITDFTGYTLEAVLKESKSTNAVVWAGHLGTDTGIELYNGVYYAHIPLNVAVLIPAGFYYLAITCEDLTTADGPTPTKQLVQELHVNVRNTAASMNVGAAVPVVGYTLSNQCLGRVSVLPPIINLYGDKDSNVRYATGRGFEFYNPDTGLWHTLMSVSNPPVVTIDGGES